MKKLTLYAVRNSEGKWFRSKGYGGYGDSWVTDVNKAKLYTKLSQAKARVTWWHNAYPEYGVSQIVVFEAEQTKIIIDEKRQMQILRDRERAVKSAAIRNAKERFKKAKEDLERLQM